MDYKVKIAIFEGPMDLLLHLIQKDDLDITDIPISQITSEYLSYIDLLQELNLSVAGEFLVMSATLMQIKAKMLLPKEQVDGEDGPDPRTELVQRIIEYQKFKEVSKDLSEKFEIQKNIMYRGAPVFNKGDQTLEVSLDKLLDAFNKVLETADKGVRDIIVEEIPVEDRIREILDTLESKPFVTFSELFNNGSSRKDMVITFLAVLELIRLHQVAVTQADSFSEIHIKKMIDESGDGPTELSLTSTNS